MKNILSFICISFVFIGINSSCDSGKKYQINNTQDWVNFVSTAPGAKEIDKCYMNMSPKQTLNIYEEMVPMMVHISTEDLHAKKQCRAFTWLINCIAVHSDRYTPEQYNQIISNREADMALRICHVSLGSEEDEITAEYGAYFRGKR